MAARKKAPEAVVEVPQAKAKKPVQPRNLTTPKGIKVPLDTKGNVKFEGKDPVGGLPRFKKPDFKEFQGHPWVGHIVEANVKPCKNTGRKSRKLSAKITGGYMGMVHFEGVGWYHESSLTDVVLPTQRTPATHLIKQM